VTVIYDAGALLRLERGDAAAWHRWKAAMAAGRPPRSHGGVVGQVWRHGSRQARLAVALRGVDIAALDAPAGREAGELLASSGTADVIDAAVVLLANDGDVIYTSDPDDLAHLVATLGLDVEVVRV
jgi:hypothetical protein